MDPKRGLLKKLSIAVVVALVIAAGIAVNKF